MRKLGVILLAFMFTSCTTKAQTWTLTRTADSVKSAQKDIVALKTKAAIKDINDDRRNLKIDSLFIMFKVVTEENRQLKLWKDSMKVFFLAPEDFIIDKDRMARLKPRIDTILIKH